MSNLSFFCNGVLVGRTVSDVIPHKGDRINLSTNAGQSDPTVFTPVRYDVVEVDHQYKHDVKADVDPTYAEPIEININVIGAPLPQPAAPLS